MLARRWRVFDFGEREGAGAVTHEQETAVSVHFEPELRFLVFDFGAYQVDAGEAVPLVHVARLP